MQYVFFRNEVYSWLFMAIGAKLYTRPICRLLTDKCVPHFTMRHSHLGIWNSDPTPIFRYMQSVLWISGPTLRYMLSVLWISGPIL